MVSAQVAAVTAEVGGSALFASRFRECAARALLLPRRDPGRRARAPVALVAGLGRLGVGLDQLEGVTLLAREV